MTKRVAHGRGNAAFFCASDTERTSAEDSPLRRKRTPRTLLDGVVEGEKVLIAHDCRPLEKGIEIRIRIALATSGVMVMKHHVDNRGQKPCPQCGHKEPARGARTGLGLGVADLICVVPPLGRFLGIEVKRPGYSPSDVRAEQRQWLAVIRRFGGHTGIATSEEEAMALVAEARRV
jgi:hypothetical protein